MEQVYLGRQAILSNENTLFAYEVLYRDNENRSGNTADRYTSASVINSVLNKFGTKAILGNRKAFVEINYKFLMSDIIFTIPNEFFIFSLMGTINMDEKVVERIQQLHKKEYILAINGVSLTQNTIHKYKTVLKELSYFKLDFSQDVNPKTSVLIGLLQSREIEVLAYNIDDNNEYELAESLGCNLFQGDFLSKPNIVHNTKYDPRQFNILKLYNLLIQDTNIDEITSAFEDNHAVTIQLLQFINSGYFHFRSKISSIHHVLTLVGRKPLSEWLMLMVYAKSISKKNEVSPLMLLAKQRTEMMEDVLKLIHPNVGSNALGEAYFVGLLSLMDVVFSMKLEAILEHIFVANVVKNALLKHEGLLGEIYLFVKDIEAFNTDKIALFISKHKIDPQVMEKLLTESMESINTFENSVQL